MTQITINWDPTINLPVQGKTLPARHAGATGAQRAGRDRGTLALQFVELLRQVGPLSDYEAAQALGRFVSSICSTRNGLGERIVASGDFEATQFGTKRARYRVAV